MFVPYRYLIDLNWQVFIICPQIAKFMGPTWGPPGSCRPQMDPMLAPWTLLSGGVSSQSTLVHWTHRWLRKQLILTQMKPVAMVRYIVIPGCQTTFSKIDKWIGFREHIHKLYPEKIPGSTPTVFFNKWPFNLPLKKNKSIELHTGKITKSLRNAMRSKLWQIECMFYWTYCWSIDLQRIILIKWNEYAKECHTL